MQLPASFSLPKLIPLSQVWQLESKSQFAQLQVRRGGVTQSINQNKITKCAISKKLTCQVAEQMTLLDSQLFQRIDGSTWQSCSLGFRSRSHSILSPASWSSSSEQCHSLLCIYWARQPLSQAEEKSMNLTKFTEHFNNMSYWTRTRGDWTEEKAPFLQTCKKRVLTLWQYLRIRDRAITRLGWTFSQGSETKERPNHAPCCRQHFIKSLTQHGLGNFLVQFAADLQIWEYQSQRS